MSNLFKGSVLGVCIATLSGCMSMAPHYQRPQSPVADRLQNNAIGQGQPNTAIADIEWHDIFQDSRLQNVIALALENNRDLRVAMLNIDKARATYRIQRADAFPSISATGTQSNSRSGTKGNSQVSHTTGVSVGLTSWELDLFGRIRSLSNEALETYFATEQTQRSSRLSLVAEVAGDWLTVAAYQQQLKFAEQTLVSQQKTLDLTQAQYKEGILSALDYESVRTSVESAKADIASYKKLLAQAKNALDLVVGSAVPTQDLPTPDTSFGSIKLASIPSQVPSSVLLNHPDVLYAEHTLKSANADIGAARAAFFPTISLTATAGRSSSQLDNLFSAGMKTWSFIPTISVPIFQGGELKATLDSAKIQKNIYIAQYEKAIQTAFSNVADALAARQYIDEQLTAQKNLVSSTQRSFNLSTALYKEGVDSYLTALTAQRSYYSAQQDLITLQLEEATNRVTLYKVFGGGADAEAQPANASK